MIRVLIAEDMLMLRKALVSLLAMEDGIDVVAELSEGADILPSALDIRPDVAVLDIDLPGMDGIEACALLHEQLPECRTLILTSLGRPGNLRRALAAHAVGFILKDAEPSRLAAAIHAVAEGNRVIDPQLALATLEADNNPLTSREVEVLQLAANGDGVRQIAARLFLAPGTVRNYLTNAVTKLNARNRIDAVRIAEEAGWL